MNVGRGPDGWRLNLTQPTLSKALQDVEATLGLSLFERTNRGLEPTPYGEIFARHAKIVLAQLRHAAEELESLRRFPETGREELFRFFTLPRRTVHWRHLPRP